MAQIKTYTVKNVVVKARVHGNGEISEEWIKEKVLENYNNEGPIPETVGSDIDPKTGQPKIRKERGFYLQVPNPLNVEEYRVSDVMNPDLIRFVQYGNRPGIHWATSLSNCKNPMYTTDIWVKYTEEAGNLKVITVYPVRSNDQDGGNKGYLPFKPWEQDLSKINPTDARKYFEDRGFVMILTDAEMAKLKDIDFNEVYNNSVAGRNRVKNVGIFGGPETPPVPMN